MWFKYLLIALYVIGPILTILSIGHERKPHTPGTAATIVIVDVLLLWGILVYWP